jgi:hypothetical protein
MAVFSYRMAKNGQGRLRGSPDMSLASLPWNQAARWRHIGAAESQNT